MKKMIDVTNIGKSFKNYKSEIYRFLTWFGFQIKPISETWVLKNISFKVFSGEAIGFIGQNGAGKSTLLKLISETMKPTEGKVKIYGRVSSILELGMGFNNDLTGRQNAINTLKLMGFLSQDIPDLIAQIESFAEIQEYFDEPIRIYSSGMQMRLAFAIATVDRPDILIVDEALSVGDTYFQHKSFSRIRDFQNKGSTLLIVSHDRNAILSLCNRAILLDHGQFLKEGTPEEVFDFYNALLSKKNKKTIQVKKISDKKSQTRSGSGEARVNEITILNKKNKSIDVVEVGEKIVIRIHVKVYKNIKSLVLGFSIKDRLGQVMYGTNTWFKDQVIHNPSKNDEYVFNINFPVNLGIGSYSIQTALVDRDTHISENYDWIDLASIFEVINIKKQTFVGCLWNESQIKIEKINA